MKTICLSVLALAALVISGCMQSKTEVFLKKDGSGTITTTEVVSASAMQMMQGMGEGADGPAGQLASLINIDEDELKAGVGKYGDDVEFVSAEAITLENGSKGRKVVYAFKDVNKLKLSPNAGNMNAETEEGEPTVAFHYEKGKLTMNFPQNPEKDEEEMQSIAELQQVPPQMKLMFNDMLVEIVLKVEGKVSETNALFPLPEKDGIVIVSMDVGKLVSNAEAIKDFSATKPSDRKAMQEVMKKYDFIKVENQEEVTVKF